MFRRRCATSGSAWTSHFVMRSSSRAPEPAIARETRRTDQGQTPTEFGAAGHVIDADRPLQEVVSDLKSLIWSLV